MGLNPTLPASYRGCAAPSASLLRHRWARGLSPNRRDKAAALRISLKARCKERHGDTRVKSGGRHQDSKITARGSYSRVPLRASNVHLDGGCSHHREPRRLTQTHWGGKLEQRHAEPGATSYLGSEVFIFTHSLEQDYKYHLQLFSSKVLVLSEAILRLSPNVGEVVSSIPASK